MNIQGQGHADVAVSVFIVKGTIALGIRVVVLLSVLYELQSSIKAQPFPKSRLQAETIRPKTQRHFVDPFTEGCVEKIRVGCKNALAVKR